MPQTLGSINSVVSFRFDSFGLVWFRHFIPNEMTFKSKAYCGMRHRIDFIARYTFVMEAKRYAKLNRNKKNKREK